MKRFELTGYLARVFEVMELFHTPMFLVLVESNGAFRFGGINRAHAQRTGLTNAVLAGRTPSQVLPPRIAETIEANYARCVTPAAKTTCAKCEPHLACPDCAVPAEYEELLELSTGALWWRTHLSPVAENGRIVALLGHSYDISEEKARFEAMTGRLKRLQNSTDDLRTLSRASASHLRGPLQQIFSFSELLRPEFKPPMDRKMSFLNGIRGAARDAMEELDKYEEDAGGLLSIAGLHTDIDFTHLCRDTAALIDPGRDLNISFPDTTLHADGEALKWVLVNSMERIAGLVGSEIGITVTPDGIRPRTLQLSISCDLIDLAGHGLPTEERNRLIAGAQVRGVLTEIIDRSLPGGRRGMTLGFAMAGRLAPGADDPVPGPRTPPARIRSGPATC